MFNIIHVLCQINIFFLNFQLIQNFEVLLPANVTDIPTVKRTFITPDAEIKLFLKERPDRACCLKIIIK